jgi:hypothetical protein
MSQFKTSGIKSDTEYAVDILYGYDTVPGFKPGYFFQVYLRSDDPEWKENSENCIENLGFLNGISEKELSDSLKRYRANKGKPVNQRHWI